MVTPAALSCLPGSGVCGMEKDTGAPALGRHVRTQSLAPAFSPLHGCSQGGGESAHVGVSRKPFLRPTGGQCGSLMLALEAGRSRQTRALSVTASSEARAGAAPRTCALGSSVTGGLSCQSFAAIP